MNVRVLINDRFLPVARLIPNEEVEIFDSFMKERLEKGGISVDKAFITKHGIQNKEWKVYPKDGKAVFAKAFEQFYFVHGLQQQGFKWKDGEKALESLKILECQGLSLEDLAKKIIEIHYRTSSKEAGPSAKSED